MLQVTAREQRVETGMRALQPVALTGIERNQFVKLQRFKANRSNPPDAQGRSPASFAAILILRDTTRSKTRRMETGLAVQGRNP